MALKRLDPCDQTVMIPREEIKGLAYEVGQIQGHPIVPARGDYSYYSINTNNNKKRLILQLEFHYHVVYP